MEEEDEEEREEESDEDKGEDDENAPKGGNPRNPGNGWTFPFILSKIWIVNDFKPTMT